MAASPEHLLTRDRAWACVTLNFSISGWGSLKAGRKFAGVCQLVCAFGGFFLLCWWMIQWGDRIFWSEIGGLGGPLPPAPAAWLWQAGVAGFVISYSWMLITCVSLMRQAKANEEKNRRNAPPHLADLPGQPPTLS